MKKLKVFKVFFLIPALFLIGTSSAHAYLDPGSGSLILQMVIGGVVAFFFAIKSYWQRIRTLLFRKRNCPEDSIKDES